MHLVSNQERALRRTCALQWLQTNENVRHWSPDHLVWDAKLRCFMPSCVSFADYDGDDLAQLLLAQDASSALLPRADSIEDADDDLLEDSDVSWVPTILVDDGRRRKSKRAHSTNKEEEDDVDVDRRPTRKRMKIVYSSSDDEAPLEQSKPEELSRKRKRTAEDDESVPARLASRSAEAALAHLSGVRAAVRDLGSRRRRTVDAAIDSLESALADLAFGRDKFQQIR